MVVVICRLQKQKEVIGARQERNIVQKPFELIMPQADLVENHEREDNANTLRKKYKETS